MCWRRHDRFPSILSGHWAVEVLRAAGPTRPHMRSSVALQLLEQEVYDIDADFQGLRQWNAVGPRGTGWSLANLQRCSVPDWDEVRDRGLAIKYRHGLPAAYRAKIGAETGLELPDAHLLRDLMMTISGLIANRK